MTSLERNGDVVQLASYAPLLGKLGHTQWDPNLIYFTNTRVIPTINYYVQQLFSCNQGDSYLAIDGAESAGTPQFGASCVRDSKSGDVILKLVNLEDQPKTVRVQFSGAPSLSSQATKSVLTGDVMAVNRADSDAPLVPQVSTINVSEDFSDQLPAHSLTVVRLQTRE
jgi:alpha-L-arabinofuranosidase